MLVALRYYMGHMSTSKTCTISSASSEETEQIGEQIGRQLKGGEIIELVSDLGGGKTTFVRGLAKGFGSTDTVASPTFTVSKEYTAGNKRVAHYDFYRLHDAGLLQFELAESVHDPDTVVVVEWGDIVRNVLPATRMTIHITATESESRSLKLTIPSEYSYVHVG